MPAIEDTALLLYSQLPAETLGKALADLNERLRNAESPYSDSVGVARVILSILDVQEPPFVKLDAVVHCTLQLVQEAGGDIARLHDAVDLCARSERLLSIVLDVCLITLEEEVRMNVENTQTFTSESALTHSVEIANERNQDVDVHVLCDSRPTARQIVPFIHALILSHVLSQHDGAIAQVLCLLARSQVEELFTASRNALIALLATPRRGSLIPTTDNPNDGFAGVAQIAWQTVQVLTSDMTRNERFTAGCIIWSRMIRSNEFALASQVLCEESYWSKLWTGLARGSPEQRKYVLSILLGSLDHVKHDIDLSSTTFKFADAAKMKSQYARFAALFETIVLSRYLNQVQDSLPDLSAMVKQDAEVHRSWILALLCAALSHGMQDSIRKVLGAWTLDNAVAIIASSPEVASEFLDVAFLPWATLGYHYTSSVRITGEGISCGHGEQVSRFLLDILQRIEDPLRVARTVLAFITTQGGRIFSFARAYLLDGVLQGLKARGVALDSVAMAYVIRIAAMQGFQSMVQDVMTIQCAQLADMAPQSVQTSHNLKPLQHNRNIVGHSHTDLLLASDTEDLLSLLAEAIGDARDSRILVALRNDLKIANFAALLRESQCQCLWRSGLLAGIHCLQRALDHGDHREDSAFDLISIIEALWEESEVQDCPRSVVRLLPPIFFHQVVLERCSTSMDLAALVSRLLLELQVLAQNRIYLFTPLAEALRRACLHSSHAPFLPVRVFIENYVNNPPAIRVEFDLEKAMEARLIEAVPTKVYASYYGKDASYGHACVFDLLNRLPTNEHWIAECRLLLDSLLLQWVQQKQPVPVFSKWKTTAQLQTMLLCLDRILPTMSTADVDDYLEKLLNVLALEPLPRLRYLLEWIIVRIFIAYPDRRISLLGMQRKMDITNPKYLVSIMKLNLVLACLPNSDQSLALELMTQLIPLSASPKIVIRHEAQWTFTPLWDCAADRGWTVILQNPAFERLNSTIRELESYKHPPAGRIFERFDAVADHNMSHLLSGDYLRIEPSESPRTSRDDLVAVLDDDILTEDKSAGELLPLGEMRSATPKATHGQSTASTAQDSVVSVNAPLQTKSSAWQEEVKSITGPGSSERHRRTRPVVVVASFIDNAFNLGGLSRLGEIFGVESLQIQNLRTLKSKDFTSVSVSSHLWLDIEDLVEDKVAAFLADKKLQGYSLVGIEQTDRSAVLGTEACKLPEKLVLVLGSEKEGIPAKVLADLDKCVEIRQMGVTRSMNVQTAAAVVLYEYSRQHNS